MTRSPFLWMVLCLAFDAHAQYEVPAKEQFDKLSHKVVYNGLYDGIINYMLNTNHWSGYQFGEQIGPALEGYVRLYETTKDKAYLIKFVNLALKAVAWHKANYRFNDLLYMDGQLLWPMAHFIHLVLVEDPDLGSFEVANNAGLIDVPTSTIPANELPAQSSYTLHEIATWLLARSVESLDAIIADEWDEDIGFEGAAAVNMQGGFAGALLHLGHMAVVNGTYSGLQSYWNLGARLAALFRSHMDIEDGCSCSSYSYPVLRTGSHNSYWWYHSGWRYDVIASCVNSCLPIFHFDQPDLNTYQEYIEDISHAIPTLIIPFMAHRYSLYTDGFYPFTDTEMVRFRNTFAKHVWDPTDGGFHNAVNGQDAPVYPPSYNGQFNILRYNVLAWMPLQHFDQTAGAATGDQVYNIIMDFYGHEVHNSPADLTGGFHYLGVAEVVAAQWERECFSLTLFSRDLVYDQDFAAKAVLTVDAFGEEGASFADPVIHEPRFTVSTGITSAFRAGSAVVWEPGFEAVYGSSVEAEIDPLGCDLVYRTQAVSYPMHTEAGIHAYTEREELLPILEAKSEAGALTDMLRIVPNPTSGDSWIILALAEERAVQVTLHDPMGRLVLEKHMGTHGPGEVRLPLTGHLPVGLYLCAVQLDERRLMTRLVVE